MRHNPLISRPIKLHWAGWETTTYHIQQAGWSLSAEQDVFSGSMRLALRHEGCRTYGLTDRVPFDYMESVRDWRSLDGLVLPVRHMSSRLDAIIHQTGPFSFAPIDAQPQLLSTERRSIEDFAAFATPLTRTQEIIVPDESVSDLLARILGKQDPARNEYFKRILREEREGMRIEAIPRQKFHAQILSIAA